MQIEAIEVEPLRVPLREPFVIATARIDETRAGLVRVRVRDGDRVEEGLGEAAPLPPVTREDWPDVEAAIHRSRALVGEDAESACDRAGELLADAPVSRAGLETAILDAVARLRAVPMSTLLGPGSACVLDTDVTLPILPVPRMVELAREWRAKGFRCFKVKVGKDLDADVRVLRGVAAAVPDASFRLDANEGFSAEQALELLRAIAGLRVECFEQPCRRDDLDAMARVTREGGVPVVADESVRSLEDLERVIAARAAHGANLKLVKLGGPRAAYEVGVRARAAGLRLMCGAMVETRLGLVAMAQVVRALDRVEWIDLDTAFLLAEEPFDGGWSVVGPRIVLHEQPGLGVRPVPLSPSRASR